MSSRHAQHQSAPPQDVLAAIADVERHVARLREQHADQQRLLDEHAHRDAALAKDRAELEDARRAMQGREQSLTEENERARKEHDTERATFEQMRRDLEQRCAAAEGEKGELEAELQRVRADRQQLRQDVQTARKQAKEAQGEASAHSAETTRALDEQRTRADGLDARTEQLTTRADELQKALTAREAELSTCEAELNEVRTDAAESRRAIEAELQEARRRLEAARSEVDELRSKAAATSSLRQTRLKRMHTMLRERAGQMRRAGDALSKQAVHNEGLAEVKSRLEAREKAVANRARALSRIAAIKSAGVGVLCAVAAMAIVAGASWLIAGRVAPSTWVAHAALAIDARGRMMTPAQTAAWQDYHEVLATDPQLLEIAATRMARRGLDKLSTAVSLKQFLDASLVTTSPRDGLLSLELTGTGAGHAARILDTLVTAMASHANAARESRADGAATIVSQEATVGSEPVGDQRVLYALGMFIVGGASCLLLGWVAWRRLGETHAHIASVEAATGY